MEPDTSTAAPLIQRTDAEDLRRFPGMKFPDRRDRAAVHPWDVYADPDDWSALCYMLGGSADSWTGAFLALCAKSDPAHIAMLKRAWPEGVLAWQLWREHATGDGTGVIVAAIGSGAAKQP